MCSHLLWTASNIPLTSSPTHAECTTLCGQRRGTTGCWQWCLTARRRKGSWFTRRNVGGDLKTTFAETQRQFDEAVDFFDWDRSRAWYMDIAHSDRDFIYAISKKNNCIFKKFINRGDDTYLRGREKYEELAFQYWCMTPPVGKLCQHTSGAASTRKK